MRERSQLRRCTVRRPWWGGMWWVVARGVWPAVGAEAQPATARRRAPLTVPRARSTRTFAATESMFWTNISGFLMALVLSLVTGHAVEGSKFCLRNPEVLQALLVYSLASAVGQNFIYYTITQFNPLVLTTVAAAARTPPPPSSRFHSLPRSALLSLAKHGAVPTHTGDDDAQDLHHGLLRLP